MKFCTKQHGFAWCIRLITLVVIISLCVSFFQFGRKTVNAATGDEIRAAKKIVSVVYDDSGSMAGDRWSYANYSMQALIALMNEQDELYITFMRQPDVSQEIPLDSLQSSVDSIRGLSEFGDTLEETLTTAMSRLDSIVEDDPTTQFWYIVMTDGEIYDRNYDNIDVQARLDSYKNKKMSNSTTLNIVYLGMCGAEPVSGDPSQRLYSFMPNDDAGIVSSMQSISNLVSSRVVADNITRINSKEIEITSNLPLYNISVLSQRSSAHVNSARTQSLDLNVQRNISLDATELENGSTIQSLYGNAAVINCLTGDSQQVIPAGTYRIVFSEDVNIDDVTIQFEPAISFSTEITRNGVVLDSTDDLEYGDKVNLRLKPVIPGTDEEIPADALPDDMAWSIEYSLNDEEIVSVNGNSITDVTIGEGTNIIRGTMLIPGFIPYTKEEKFEVIKEVIDTEVIEIVYNFGITVNQPDGLSYDRRHLKELVFDADNTVGFHITNDGIPLSSAEQARLGVSLELESFEYSEPDSKGVFDWLGSKYFKCHLEQNDDGSYSLIPDAPSYLLTPLVVKAGTYKATVKLAGEENVKAEGYFKVVRNPSDFWDVPRLFAVIVVLLYLAYIMFVKKKFKRQKVYCETWKISEDGTGYRLNNSTEPITLTNSNLLLPKSACYKHFRGLKLVAESDGEVIITGKSIANAVEKYGTSVYSPERKLGRIAKQLHSTIQSDNKIREASDMELTDKPIYFMTTKDSSEVWRIWMIK